MVQGKRVLMLIEEGFEDSEAWEPKLFLEAHGVSVTVTGPEIKTYHGKKGEREFTPEKSLAEVHPGLYDLLLIPGGAAPEKLRLNVQILSLVRAFAEAHKPLAAICHGPQVLISAGLLEGRMLTSTAGIRDDVRNAGGHWVDEELVIDRNLITSRGPRDLPAFNQAILKALG